jgi:hypothetical protein
VEQANDFIMRSLRQDIGVVEIPLSRLQKVGDELAASPGHRRGSVAHAFSTGEVSITRKKALRKVEKHSKKWRRNN